MLNPEDVKPLRDKPYSTARLRQNNDRFQKLIDLSEQIAFLSRTTNIFSGKYSDDNKDLVALRQLLNKALDIVNSVVQDINAGNKNRTLISEATSETASEATKDDRDSG